MNSIAAFLIILASATFGLQARAAVSDGADRTASKLSAEINLVQGQSKTLTPPLTLSGKLRTESFVITRLPIESIQTLVIDEKPGSQKGYLLTLRGVSPPMCVTIEGDAEIAGSGEWGRERIVVNTIKSLTVIGGAEGKPFAPKHKWTCTLKTGESIVIGWQSEWSRDRVFVGGLGQARLNLAGDRVSRLTTDKEDWAVLFGDEPQLKGWRPKQRSFEADSLFGPIELRWESIAGLVRQTEAASGSEAKPQTPVSPTWMLEVGGHFLLPIADLALESGAKINGELHAKSLNWDFIDSVAPAAGGLDVRLANSNTWLLQSTLAGLSAYGKVVVPCEDIAKLERKSSPPTNRIPAEYAKEIVGSLTTAKGTVYPVATPSLLGGTRAIDDHDYWGYNLFRIEAPPVEHWIDPGWLLSHRFTVTNRRVVSDHPILKQHGPLPGLEGVAFANAAGKFEIAIGEVKEFAPQMSPSIGAKTARLARFQIAVRDAKGPEFSAEVTAIEFARYPKYGWTGSYSKPDYPFQWHRDSTLFFKKDSTGERIDVDFGRLKRVEITGLYDSSRPAKLTSTQGSVVTGSIYPGDVAKSHGVSTWNPDKEGLLFETTEGAYVFVRFANGKVIEITQRLSQ